MARKTMMKTAMASCVFMLAATGYAAANEATTLTKKSELEAFCSPILEAVGGWVGSNNINDIQAWFKASPELSSMGQGKRFSIDIASLGDDKQIANYAFPSMAGLTDIINSADMNGTQYIKVVTDQLSQGAKRGYVHTQWPSPDSNDVVHWYGVGNWLDEAKKEFTICWSVRDDL